MEDGRLRFCVLLLHWPVYVRYLHLPRFPRKPKRNTEPPSSGSATTSNAAAIGSATEAALPLLLPCATATAEPLVHPFNRPPLGAHLGDNCHHAPMRSSLTTRTTNPAITAGYHRLWSHTSYTATLPLRVFLAAFGAGAIEGSIRWWSRDHRAHHRYTDTDKDPYSVRKGLWYSHMGWILMKQNPRRIGRTDISDLNEDPIVVFQHRHYVKCALFMGLALPGLVAWLLWDDLAGGIVYAGFLRIFFVQQATFCINSLAHWIGEQPFDDRNSPRDHWITALATLGEGYHNFHHEFPSDYRNAIEWWQYDPTKWFIWAWKQMGLASDLKQFRTNEIEKGRLQMSQKQLDRKRAQLDWGVPLDKLPVISWDEYVAQARTDGRAWIAVAGVIHDVSDFVAEHPGGRALIRGAIGEDATAMFNGGVYDHSNAAHNLLSTMRVGVIRGGMEVELWKRQHKQDGAEYVKDSYGNRVVRADDQVTKMRSPQVISAA